MLTKQKMTLITRINGLNNNIYHALHTTHVFKLFSNAIVYPKFFSVTTQTYYNIIIMERPAWDEISEGRPRLPNTGFAYPCSGFFFKILRFL